MPGRQSTGPPSAAKKPKPSYRAKKRSLNAFAIAAAQSTEKRKQRGGRFGELEYSAPKRRREGSEDSEPSGDEDGRGTKRLKRGQKDKLGREIEGGSDSEGNEWVTNQVDSDDDSSLDSDDALGESDEEQFEDFTFRGSRSKNVRSRQHGRGRPVAGEEEEEEEGEAAVFDLDEVDGSDDELESGEESDNFAENAIDLVDMLDQSDGDEDKIPARKKQSDDGYHEGDDSESQESESDSESQISLSEEEDSATTTKRLAALQEMVSSLANGDASKKSKRPTHDAAQEAARPSEYGLNARQKLTVADLLPTVTDPKLRKSLKLLADDGKPSKGSSKGIPGKLDVPLAKRQQDRLDRAAAYEKSKETLDRWIDTVKHNRRAEHLSFPLIDPDLASAKNTSKLQPISQSKPANDLEARIQNILIESGMADKNGKSQEDHIQAFEELATNKLPIEEVQARRAELRKARELLFREEIRAKRIKKIKSKSYRRVHRRERERQAQKEHDEMVANGIELSEDEKESQDRRRAEERMGARHRESKWAKGVKQSGRAAWDEDARGGVTDMARREEELRKRIEGRDVRDEDASLGSETDSSDDQLSDEDGELAKQKLSSKLDGLSKAEGGGGDKLSGMKFMQKAEAARRARNDEDIERMRREMEGEDSLDESTDEETSGRRTFGPRKDVSKDQGRPVAERSEFEERAASDEDEENGDGERLADGGDIEIITNNTSGQNRAKSKQSPLTRAKPVQDRAEIDLSTQDENPWEVKLKKRSQKKSMVDDVDIITPDASYNSKVAIGDKQATKNETKTVSFEDNNGVSTKSAVDISDTDASSPEPETPVLSKNQALISQAFAGEDILASFATEKAALEAEDFDALHPRSKESDALPGWGSWTGAGLPSKYKKQLAAKHQKKQEQPLLIKGKTDIKRRDGLNPRAIVSEKRVHKNVKFMATQLPHPFETKAQYERSLRIPVGPEWTTKDSFQRATKPRVMIKGGVIAPMTKPL